MINGWPDLDEEADLGDIPLGVRVTSVIAEIQKTVAELPLRATIVPWKNAYSGEIHAIEINELYADKPGAGAGTIFMQKICELADAAELSIYTHPEGPQSKAFYEKFGFDRSANNFGMIVRHPPMPIFD